tara:strand:- start:341 stop:1021 length:681 start_codon:yes stop_codon:yes gene_type:complete
MANKVDAPGATSPNTVNNRLGDGAKENFTEYVIQNDKGSISLGSIDKQAAVTSGVSLNTPDGEHCFKLDIDGPRKGWTTSTGPGNFTVECGSANEEAEDTIMINAKNGNINIVATNGKIRLQGTDIELVAVGAGDNKGNIKMEATESIITNSKKLMMSAKAYYRIATPGIGEVVANAVLQMYGSIFRGVSDGCVFKNSKVGGQAYVVAQTALAAQTLTNDLSDAEV